MSLASFGAHHRSRYGGWPWHHGPSGVKKFLPTDVADLRSNIGWFLAWE